MSLFDDDDEDFRLLRRSARHKFNGPSSSSSSSSSSLQTPISLFLNKLSAAEAFDEEPNLDLMSDEMSNRSSCGHLEDENRTGDGLRRFV